jgi:hypothetical protein
MTESLPCVRNDVSPIPWVLAHCHLAAPLVEASLAGRPIVYRNYPVGVEEDGVFHVAAVPLSTNKLLWCILAKCTIRPTRAAPIAAKGSRQA